ncbi:hypothetical protein ONZ51_g13468 [Trametes cubensis]|uniref:BTB domain-containing protein n=1 Tax=Trametes cubensis TaxID=1111947 RepID=A0AAD7TE96_9APHY|nr:hypothetical protein ONZ51_g13468 [Trametes cubensis]
MATESEMRPSPAASHVQTKLASPKRPPYQLQDAADTTPQKRRKMTLPAYHRSQEFWYPDGNIVVIVNKVGHKVHLSRLQRLCGFFKDQFPIAPERTESTGDDDDSQALPTAPQSYILTDVNLADFQEVLRTLETPLCGLLRLDILAVIDAARKYAVPAALKRVLCALLLNPPVWERTPAGQPMPEPLDGGVEVPLSDVLMLYHARHVLQHEWSTLLFRSLTVHEKSLEKMQRLSLTRCI